MNSRLTRREAKIRELELLGYREDKSARVGNSVCMVRGDGKQCFVSRAGAVLAVPGFNADLRAMAGDARR